MSKSRVLRQLGEFTTLDYFTVQTEQFTHNPTAYFSIIARAPIY